MKALCVLVAVVLALPGFTGMALADPTPIPSPLPAAPPPPPQRFQLSPAAVGWGNTLVPGRGATLRGQPGRGLLEATLEVGTFYGGVNGVKEGGYSIDGTVPPTKGNLYRTASGQVLQQFGLKLHMFDTFYHYQQVALEQKDSERERSNPHRLYQGSWTDVLEAPFQWRYLSSPWVYPVILGGTAYLLVSYATSTVDRVRLHAPPGAEALYAFSQGAMMPLGSAFGEEVFFRGFVEREIRGYTDSLAISVVAESSLFALGHQDRLTSFLVGTYFGLLVPHLGGDLGYAIAPHFWLDVVDGLTTYWALRRAQGKNAPFNPAISVKIPF